MRVSFKKLRPDAQIPQYQTPGSAGMDLHAALTVTLSPMERKLVPTGLAIAIPMGYEGQVRPRSGLALKLGLSIVNTPGTIDSDYRGELGVLLINLGEEDVVVQYGDRIAQLVITPIMQAEILEVEDLGTTARSAGGFGSTGV